MTTTSPARGTRRDLVAAVAVALAVLGLVLLQSVPANPDVRAPGDGIRFAGQALRGEGPRSDFAANYVGARALAGRDDPYVILGPAFEKVGLDWYVSEPNTHPPTALLEALPVAALP